MNTPMVLKLVDLTSLAILGPLGTSYKGVMPKRMKFFHPSAAKSFKDLVTAYPGVAMSDGYRDAMASLVARQNKSGVQPPGWSGHNYGISFDCDVEQTLKNLKVTYSSLLELFKSYGWTCHRADGQLGSESWHFNCLSMGDNPPKGAEGPQLWMRQNYPMFCRKSDATWNDLEWVQTMLQKLKLYGGAVDGSNGPLTRAGINAFCKAYDLKNNGPDERVIRTLAIVTAEKEITKL
jgi:hypothetical protein